MTSCSQELCEYWGGDGRVCNCALFDGCIEQGAGYRRVTTDPETVDKIAKALHADANAWLMQRQANEVYTWDSMSERAREDYRRTARVALSALTGEETP